MDDDFSIYHIPMNLILESSTTDKGKLFVGISKAFDFLFFKEITNLLSCQIC